MSAVKSKISQALEHNSSRTAGTRSARQPLAARTGGLRIVHGDEAYDSSRHLGDLSLDAAQGGVYSNERGAMGTHSDAMSAPVNGAQTQAATASHMTHSTGTPGQMNQVVDTQIFTRTEDRQVVVRTVIRELHHRPIEKQYQVQTRYVGAKRVHGAPTELVGTEEKEIERRVIEAPAGDRKVVVENVDIPREALQREVIDINRHHASGTHAVTGDSNMRGGSAMASSSGTTTSGAAANMSGASTAHSSHHSTASPEFGSSVKAAMASAVGSPYSFTQPGTMIEEVDQILDTHTFTKTEDHEVIVETVIHELHHRPVQKQYMVQTRLVGEQRVAGSATEFLGTEEREVEERLKKLPACDRTVVVKNVDVPAGSVQAQTGSTREFSGGSTTGALSGAHAHHGGSTSPALHTTSGVRDGATTSYGTDGVNMAHRERGSSGMPAIPGMSGSSGSAGASRMQDRSAAVSLGRNRAV